MTEKYEREIEEILRGLDEFVPEEPLSRRVQRRTSDWSTPYKSLFHKALRDWRKYITVQWMMVASISLIMLGFLLRMVSYRLAAYANALGFLLFVAVLALAVFHLGGPRRPRTWRGRDLNISYYESWWDSLRRRLRVWWRGRR